MSSTLAISARFVNPFLRMKVANNDPSHAWEAGDIHLLSSRNQKLRCSWGLEPASFFRLSILSNRACERDAWNIRDARVCMAYLTLRL